MKKDILSSKEEFEIFEAQIDSPEFRNWFKGSSVVDENGDPKVVYHGTPSPTFEEFQFTVIFK